MPHSFVLPLSVRSEQLHYRRWDQAYSFMRVSAVAVSFVLVILLSGDALFGSGFIQIPDLASTPSMRAGESVQKQVAEGPELEKKGVEAPTAAGGAGLRQSVATAPAEPEVAAEAIAPTEAASVSEGSSQPTGAAALRAAPETSAPAGMGGEAEQQAAAPQAAPAEPSYGVGGPSEPSPASRAPAAAKSSGIKGATTATAAPAPVSPPEAASPSPEHLADTATVENAAPTPKEKPQAESEPSPTAGRVAAEIVQQSPAVPTAEAEVQQEERAVPEEASASGMLSGLWTLWRTVRLLSGVSLGLLLVLLAGLLWAGQRRRI